MSDPQPQESQPGDLCPGSTVLVQFDHTPAYVGLVVEVEPGGFCLVTTPDPLYPVARFPIHCLSQPNTVGLNV